MQTGREAGVPGPRGSSARGKALEGVVVLELGMVMQVPLAGQMLAISGPT